MADFSEFNAGTPLHGFLGPEQIRVEGKLRYRRSILVLNPKNGEYKSLNM